MKTHLLLRGALTAILIAGASTLRAQAQFAGTYTGTINSRVTAPVIGTIEAAAGVYIAGVNAAGEINVSNGVLTGTVSASGAVTFTGGSGIASFGIRSATISGTTMSSGYGDTLGNGTTQFRLNPSTGFTPASGGGGEGAVDEGAQPDARRAQGAGADAPGGGGDDAAHGGEVEAAAGVVAQRVRGIVERVMGQQVRSRRASSGRPAASG